MKGPRELLEHEDRWVTAMGKWFPGERTVFRGKDLHREFAQREWMELYVYAITGREFAPNQIELLNSMWVYTSYPDPRLWNNRVAALAGTVRSTGSLALSAALAVSEATVYGGRAALRAIDLLIRLRGLVEGGSSIDAATRAELKRYRVLPGYGRPVARVDERIPYLIQRADDLGLSGGACLAVALEVEEWLRVNRYRQSMNYAALTAALCADLGFSVREFHLFAYGTFMAGYVPCYLDTVGRPEGAFFPLPCERIRYQGCSKRRWF